MRAHSLRLRRGWADRQRCAKGAALRQGCCTAQPARRRTRLVPPADLATTSIWCLRHLNRRQPHATTRPGDRRTIELRRPAPLRARGEASEAKQDANMATAKTARGKGTVKLLDRGSNRFIYSKIDANAGGLITLTTGSPPERMLGCSDHYEIRTRNVFRFASTQSAALH